MRKVIQSPVICLLLCHYPVGSVFNGLVSFVIFLCTLGSLMFCTLRPRPSDVNLKISSHLFFPPSHSNTLRPFSCVCYWVTISKLFFSTNNTTLNYVHWSSFCFGQITSLFLSFLSGLKNLWGFIVVIFCYRKAEKAQCEPQLCPDKHSTFSNYLQESKVLLYKCIVRFLFMQQN